MTLGVGMMSGTSLDGMDFAAVRFDSGWAIPAAETYPYSDEWRNRLEALPRADAAAYAKTNVDYGHLIGMTLRRFMIEAGVKPDFVAAHGHTIFHQPERHFTAQIGDGETIATYLSCPLVTNFRNKDVALGGEGAPLAPFGEHHLFPDTAVFLNLGGIANVSILRPFAVVSQRKGHTAYDVAPCNQILNGLARRLGHAYDAEGATARSGRLLPDVFAALESLPYYYLPPPRSLGREWVEAEAWPLLESGAPADLLHTSCVHIASRLAAEFERHGVRDAQLLVTGGGAHNVFLMELLAERLAPLNLTIQAAPPLLIDYKEALLFAFLGLECLRGRPNVLNTATGARAAAVSGSIHQPGQGAGLDWLSVQA